jgi:K+/H+ antiporter YhaU regulatory subunit KhtT
MREHTGALVLALRDESGAFRTNPPPETEIRAGQVIIAIGTQEELDALVAFVAADGDRADA